MACSKSDTCANHRIRCYDCFVISSPFQEHPYYIQKKVKRVRFKIFFGNHTVQSADDKLNQWIAENPNAHILSYQYQEARIGDHSICIQYEEEVTNNERND